MWIPSHHGAIAPDSHPGAPASGSLTSQRVGASRAGDRSRGAPGGRTVVGGGAARSLCGGASRLGCREDPKEELCGEGRVPCGWGTPAQRDSPEKPGPSVAGGHILPTPASPIAHDTRPHLWPSHLHPSKSHRPVPVGKPAHPLICRTLVPKLVGGLSCGQSGEGGSHWFPGELPLPNPHNRWQYLIPRRRCFPLLPGLTFPPWDSRAASVSSRLRAGPP